MKRPDSMASESGSRIVDQLPRIPSQNVQRCENMLESIAKKTDKASL